MRPEAFFKNLGQYIDFLAELEISKIDCLWVATNIKVRVGSGKGVFVMNTNKFGVPKILGRFKLSILIALVVVLCSSALMIAKLNADVGVANLAS